MNSEELKLLIAPLPEPVVLVESNARLLVVNPAAAAVLKIPQSAAAGRMLDELVAEPAGDLLNYLKRCARNRQMVLGRVLLPGDDDQPVSYRCEGAVVQPASPERPAVLLLRLKPRESASNRFVLLNNKIDELAREIRVRRRAESERQQMLEREQRAREEAETANRLKDEFLAIVSHELRTPLNAILGWSRMLASGDLDAETTAQAVATIERNAKSQAQIIEDLLDVSRIITGKVRLDVQPVDLASVIEAAVDAVRPAADARKIRLQLLLDPAAGPVSGDPDRLQQIVWNLVSNALKFTPKEGRVQVRLMRINSHIDLEVSDNGMGISPDVLPYIFDRFRQADSSSTRRHGGLGLGLAIVRHLVELHGGVVHAHSDGEGSGSTFTVTLPLMIFHKPEVLAPQPSDTKHVVSEKIHLRNVRFDGLRLLLVDDEPDARQMLTALFTRYGAEICAVGSAAEAMSVIAEFGPDVLISDIEMPGEDGYTFIRKVRALENRKLRRIPAVALTAYTRSEDRMRALSAGFQMHVAKPVEPAELLTVVVSMAERLE